MQGNGSRAHGVSGTTEEALIGRGGSGASPHDLPSGVQTGRMIVRRQRERLQRVRDHHVVVVPEASTARTPAAGRQLRPLLDADRVWRSRTTPSITSCAAPGVSAMGRRLKRCREPQVGRDVGGAGAADIPDDAGAEAGLRLGQRRQRLRADGALDDGALEQAGGQQRRHQGVLDGDAAARSSKRRHVARTAAERHDVVVHPADRRLLVQDAVVAGDLGRAFRIQRRSGQEPEGAEPVVERDDDVALPGDDPAAAVGIRAAAELAAAAMDERHDRPVAGGGLVVGGQPRPGVQVEAVLAARSHPGPRLRADAGDGGGGRNRSGPTGGGAYGMPRKTAVSSCSAPMTTPPSILTRGAAALADAGMATPASTAATAARRRRLSLFGRAGLAVAIVEILHPLFFVPCCFALAVIIRDAPSRPVAG